MSSMLTCQGVVLATAMAVSAGTIILFDLCRERYLHSTSLILRNHDSHSDQNLKSCLSSGGKKRKKKKSKRVRFADDVRETRGNGELYRRKHRESDGIQKSCCGNQIIGLQKVMPANRAVLYSGILKGRVQRIAYSY
ncbi:hypothetical protein ABFX02_09G090400 [Erythranthe guttata]